MSTAQAADEVVDAELLADITGDVFVGMFGEDQHRPVVVADGDPGEVSSSVDISGGWVGVVTFSCSLDLARSAAVELLGLSEADVTAPDVTDLVGEIVNVVGGNVKSLLPGPSALSLPYTAPAIASSSRADAVAVSMHWRGHALRIEVLPGDADRR